MKHLKTFRQQLGVSQKYFAALMGCSPGQLAMAESRLRKLPLSPHATIMLQHAPAITAAKNHTPATTINDARLPALKKMQKVTNVKLVRQHLQAEALENAIAAADNMLAFAAMYQQAERFARTHPYAAGSIAAQSRGEEGPPPVSFIEMPVANSRAGSHDCKGRNPSITMVIPLCCN